MKLLVSEVGWNLHITELQVLFVSALEGEGVEELRALLCGRQMLKCRVQNWACQ